MTPVAQHFAACSVRAPLPQREGKEPLTTREREALDAITAWIDSEGVAPLRCELARALCISPGRASWVVVTLRSKGWIRLLPHVARSIEVV